MNTFDVRKSERVCNVGNEANLLPGRIDERKATRGIQHGERQTGEAGARPDICDSDAVKVSMNGEAIEE